MDFIFHFLDVTNNDHIIVISNQVGGDGITRIEVFAIFVKNAKAGDKNVKIKINSIGNRSAVAELVSGTT
jgi:predicted RNA-binding protein with TRAM domain